MERLEKLARLHLWAGTAARMLWPVAVAAAVIFGDASITIGGNCG